MSFPFMKDATINSYSVQQRDNSQRKEIVITYRKTLGAAFLLIIVFSIFIFFILSYGYTSLTLLLLLAIILSSEQYSKKISIIRNISDNSMTIHKQTGFKKEIDYYKQEDKPQLKLLKLSDVKERFTDTDHFALSVASDNKITLLRFLDAQFIEGRTSYFTRYQNVPLLKSKEAQDISIFLDIPLSSKPGDLMALLKEKGFY